MYEVDMTIIGGGLVGASIAWGLARSGTKPLVLDGADLDLRASRANFALVWVQGKGLHAPHYALWSDASARRWPTMANTLLDDSGIDVGLQQDGAFTFALSEEELEANRQDMESIELETNGRAPQFEVLDRQQTLDRVLGIGPEVVGSIYCAADGHVNALRLFHALHAAMERQGATYRPNHPVQSIEPTTGGFILKGEAFSILSRRIVLAAGLDNKRLAPMVGLSCPLKRSKGQILVTEKTQTALPCLSAGMRQADEGGIMIGDSEETDNTRISSSPDISAVLASRALRIFPALSDLNVVRSWTGFRVKTADGVPIYDHSERYPGAFLVACHSGVTLAANHALIVAQQIAAGQLEDELSVFSARRFHAQQAV
ncbi:MULTISPECIES: opine oxidase subunit OoxB [Rhizobium/Agrobacterium group]|uniref:Opine oxidase subunit B n=3 Tax=Agrobacterium tumefaciens TaxID=358 RepID=OOXB_AGRT4|nr:MULTISPECIES: opine oxidase subunit OoxB [Rhizobium/Agrobacterium group]Q59159.1 RecName: Full=Opine oxidase subunit B; AltName: Full=Octopine oxidase subunit B [Agrobacterium tumefaciens (strain Ach5)]AKC10923.1 D-nopaline dehydrogenase [Agrobacterium tumefaciens]AAF77141.1 ooxB [Agrobacterium tumefaciens]ABB59523.1 OxxB [Agrobacterium tumefaciens]ASK41543.1 opine oxidase subunit B [Agrobacterium tumefaciens]ASK47161.1 opine oxidase subunit B [Agrobacterium radiobacter]